MRGRRGSDNRNADIPQQASDMCNTACTNKLCGGTSSRDRGNMPNHEVHLRFHGPFKLCGHEGRILFDEEKAKLAGIYLWTVRFRDGFLINYVGETGVSFYKRMKEHAIQCMGGNYRICDPEWLRKGEKRILWNGMWRKGTRNLMQVFADKYVELAPVIKEYLETLDIFIAPIQTNKRIRQRIEGAIAFSLREQPPPIGPFMSEDVRYFCRKEKEMPIQVMIDSDEKLFGLNSKVLA